MKIMDVIEENYAFVFDYSLTEIHIHFLHGGGEITSKNGWLRSNRARYARFRAVLDLAGSGPAWAKKHMNMSIDEFELLWRGS